jgi:hypothetical protein
MGEACVRANAQSKGATFPRAWTLDVHIPRSEGGDVSEGLISYPLCVFTMPIQM